MPELTLDEALRCHLEAPSEATRYGAYELGRRAVEDGPGVVGALEALARAVSAEIFASGGEADGGVVVARTADFLVKYLAPLELIVSGTRESLRELQRSHTQLREQTRQLERSNTELLAAKHDAEQARRAQANFLASMSHEIQTPINAIIGMTSLHADSPLESEQREWAEVFRGSAEHLLGLVNEILDFSKIEAGRMHLELRVHDRGRGGTTTMAPRPRPRTAAASAAAASSRRKTDPTGTSSVPAPSSSTSLRSWAPSGRT
jgi:signal transduction histidine kinase